MGVVRLVCLLQCAGLQKNTWKANSQEVNADWEWLSCKPSAGKPRPGSIDIPGIKKIVDKNLQEARGYNITGS